MTRDDTIRMAREAGIDMFDSLDQRLGLFAALVAAAEREAIIGLLSRTEFTSLEHMPHEAALMIRMRGGK